MTAKILKFDEDARRALEAGVNKLADTSQVERAARLRRLRLRNRGVECASNTGNDLEGP